MGPDVDKLARRVAGDLEPGEHLLVAVKAFPRGGAEAAILGAAGAAALGGAGAVALAASAGEAATPDHAAAAAGVTTDDTTSVLAAVSDRRVLVWRQGVLGRPVDLLGAIARTQLADAYLGEARLLGQTMPEVVLETASGGTVGLRVGKLHRSRAEAFVAILRDPNAA